MCIQWDAYHPRADRVRSPSSGILATNQYTYQLPVYVPAFRPKITIQNFSRSKSIEYAYLHPSRPINMADSRSLRRNILHGPRHSSHNMPKLLRPVLRTLTTELTAIRTIGLTHTSDLTDLPGPNIYDLAGSTGLLNWACIGPVLEKWR